MAPNSKSSQAQANNPHLLFNFPCSLLLLDDDETLLSTLKRALGSSRAVVAFSSTTSAFQRVMQSHNIAEHAFNIFEPYSHEIEGAENGDDLVLIKSAKLEQLCVSSDKYKMISVAIIDQIMPRISGTEFCKQIEETGVKKILLTGKMTNPETIDAFNDGLIDGYVSKNDPKIRERLHALITKLHWEFIQEQTEHLTRAFDASHRQFLGHHAINKILEQANESFAYSEYFYAPAAPGFLLINEKGERAFCLIDSDQNQIELADILAETHGETDTIKQLKGGEVLCWNPFDRPTDLNFDQAETLNDRLFDCSKFNEFRWCLIPIDQTPYNNDQLEISWSEFRTFTNVYKINEAMLNA